MEPRLGQLDNPLWIRLEAACRVTEGRRGAGCRPRLPLPLTLRGARTERGWLGVSLSAETEGVRVAAVERGGKSRPVPGRPGPQRGRRAGAEDGPVQDSQSPAQLVAGQVPGAALRLTTRRKDDVWDMRAVMGEQPVQG